MNDDDFIELEKALKGLVNDPNFEMGIRRLASAQSSKKLQNYFLDILRTNAFQREVAAFRVKYGIPEGGFRESEEHLMFQGFQAVPKRWEYALNHPSSFWENLLRDERLLCQKFHIPMGNETFVSEYLMYNVVSTDTLQGICSVEEAKFFGGNQKSNIESNGDYPVLIRISPYASQRDILDYIKAVYTSQIEPLQKKYRDADVGLGRSKTKDVAVQERNNFIYDHRHLSLNETKKLLREKSWFGKDILGQSEIASIRSIEAKKRRKKV